MALFISIYIRTYLYRCINIDVYEGSLRGGQGPTPSPCIKVTDPGITAFGLYPWGVAKLLPVNYHGNQEMCCSDLLWEQN